MDQTALFEFDSSQTAFINASDEIDVEIQASKAIVSYWQEDLDRILSHSNLRLLFDFPTETATIPFYYDALHQLIYVFPYACASIAAGTIDRLAALGVKEVLIYGHCFNLDLSSGLLVSSALRDEGTSFHYMAPTRYVDADNDLFRRCQQYILQNALAYETGRVWTTDAIYRLTSRKIEAYKKEGCKAVDQETSAYYAVAQFRQVQACRFLTQQYDESWMSHALAILTHEKD